ncbi:hypothetical protein GCM10023324_56530 [Streptomyces youssoufiensis]
MLRVRWGWRTCGADHGRRDRAPDLAYLRRLPRDGGGLMARQLVTGLTEAEREELSRKNAEQNQRSERHQK